MKGLKNKIFFLGTGGGGSMLSLQKLSTAGAWFNIEGVNLFLDPGPGALRVIRQAGLDPNILAAILVSHFHIDHAGELSALVDVVHNQITWKKEYPPKFKKDFLVFKAPEVQLNGFQQKLPRQVINLKPRQSYKIKHLKITTTKDLLEKPWRKNGQNKFHEFGFVIQGAKISLALIPETYYQKNLFKNLGPIDILVLNFIAPREPERQMMARIIVEIAPQLVVLTHWAKGAYLYGIEKARSEVQKMAGVKIMAARDGKIFDLTKMKFVK